MEEERRLAYVGITRAEQKLFLTHANMRTLYGKTNFNPMSRFINEIPDELLEGYDTLVAINDDATTVAVQTKPKPRPKRKAHKIKTIPNADWKIGDKAQHKMWGIGTVVSVKGDVENLELDIAFPAPTGIKRLLANFAPITKV